MQCGSERDQDAVLGGKSYKSEKVTEEKKLMKWYEENNHHALDKKCPNSQAPSFYIRKKTACVRKKAK